MMKAFLPVIDLAKELSIPAATLRRYIRQHAHFLDVNRTRKSYMIAEESTDTLRQIREGYSQGLSAKEVNERLSAAGVPRCTVAADERTGDHVNARLVEAMTALQNLVIERLDQQDQILSSLAEIASTMQAVDPEAQRVERVNVRLNEWRIERKLMSEAMTKWAALPKADRLVRMGLFKTKEDVEKRECFVREYVDKHFDDEMRNAYGV